MYVTFGGDNLRTLFISTVPPEQSAAAWHYIYSLAKVFSKYSNVQFWFSLLNGNYDEIRDFEFAQVMNISNKSLLALRLMSILKNTRIVRGYHKEFLASLKEILSSFQPNVIVFTDLSAGSYIFDVKKINPSVYTILIQHNVEYLVSHELSKYGESVLQRLYHGIQKPSVSRFEQSVMLNVDLVISVSPSDKEYFMKYYDISENKIEVVRPIFEYDKSIFEKKHKSGERVISFIGNFRWYPNIKGAEFFVEKVLPTLTKKFPYLQLYLVGRNPAKRIFNLQKKYPKNIIVTGTVKDTSEYYKISDCIIIPVFLGPGIKLKVLEAMASGVPTVMTSYVAKDYELLDRGLCIADQPEDFIQHVEKILEDSEYSEAISKKQVEWYEEYMIDEEQKFETILKKIFSQVKQ